MKEKVVVKTVCLERWILVVTQIFKLNLKVSNQYELKRMKLYLHLKPVCPFVFLVVRGPQVIIYCGSTATSSPTSMACATLKEQKEDQEHPQSRGITEITPVVLPAHTFPLRSRGFCSWFSTMMHTNVCSNVSNAAAG